MRCGDGADAGDGYYEASVFLDADDRAFGSFEFAGYDAYPLSLLEVVFGVKVFYAFAA